uniref:FimV/HubP family polar landmark protein n=1 Tax=Marinobacterium profundum TaxID=1714300 RepID=UPI000830F538|nr:FimV/HubP family polar landmark protein [Marinobacterium profundum]
MLRKLALSLAIAGVLGASQAHALGLGQIRIKSALNEPLDAEIQLLQVRDLDPQQVVPKMADLDQFAMAGIDRSRLLSDVQFTVNINQNGTGSIRLTSSRPVREPFLNLLVEVNWPNGRLVREYTVLLDPPAFQAATIGGSAAPVPAQATRSSVPAPQPVFAPPSRSRPAADNIRTNMNGQTQVYVESNDTLGGLAKRHSPGGGTSINQMMLALQRKNPQAFPSSNINFLKAGVVLDLPSLNEVQALSAREASNEVARQMQRWKTGTAAPAPSAPQEDGSKKKPLAPAEGQSQLAAADAGQLKILSAPDQGEVTPEKDEAGATKVVESPVADPEKAELLRRNEELDNRLAVTQESVDKIERDNTELNDKLTAISQQMETLQRLLELKDQQLAALQDQLQQVQPAAAAPVAAAKPAPEGLVETVLQTPAYMAALGAVIGGLLVGLLALGRRRREDDDLVESAEAEPDTKAGDTPDAGLAGAAVAAAAGTAAGATAVWIADDELDQEARDAKAEFEGVQAGVTDDTDEFDLDLDLDLADETPVVQAVVADTPAAVTTTTDRPLFDDDEFDLSLDTDFEEDMPVQDQVKGLDDDFDESLDDLLGPANGDEADARRSELRSGMGQLGGEVEAFDEPEDTLESLGLNTVIEGSNVPESAQEDGSDYRSDGQTRDSDTEAAPEAETAEEDDGLDFRLNQVAPLDFSKDDDDLIDLTAGSGEADQTKSDSDLQPNEVEFSSPATDSSLGSQSDEQGAENSEAVQTVEGAESLEGAESFDDAALEAALEPTLDLDFPGTDTAAAIDDDALEFELDDELVFNPSGAKDALQAESVAQAKPVANEPLDELDALLAESLDGDDQDDADTIELADDGDDDLDAMLAALESESGSDADALSVAGASLDADEMDVTIDDDMDLDTELEALLGSVDDDIALDDSGADDEDRGFDDMGFLEGTDEVETKLDLARAYIDMEDRDGAKDILSEILSDGSDAQQQEARKLMESIA